MSSDPPVKNLDDVIRWVAAHRAQTRERHASQEKRDHQVDVGLDALATRLEIMGGRVSCLERTIVRSTTIAAVVGAGLGAAAVQLFRHYLTTGAV